MSRPPPQKVRPHPRLGDPDIGWSTDHALHAQRFFDRVLRHTRGRAAGKPFRLHDSQRWRVIAPLYGWRQLDPLDGWVRAYSELVLEMPRGNGKTEIAAGIGLYELVTQPAAPEVYFAARTAEQAALAWSAAETMVNASPELSALLRIVPSRRRIIAPQSGGWMRVIAADALSQLGGAPAAVILDEYQAQRSGALYDALRQGAGKRADTLIVLLGTAGAGPGTWGRATHDVAERVAADPALDPSRLVVIDSAPTSADWTKPATWRRANPALRGRWLSQRTLAIECARAQLNPSEEWSFRTYRLNQWLANEHSWTRLALWSACPDEPLDVADLAGRPVWGGIDLAATHDLAAMAWIADSPTGDLEAVWRIWVTDTAHAELDRETAGQWSQWADAAGVIVCSQIIDHDDIADAVIADAARLNVADVGVDRFDGAHVLGRLADHGVPATSLNQGTYLSPAVKKLADIVGSKQLRHGGNPVAAWSAVHAVARHDANERVMLVRPPRSAGAARIDPLAALVMAVDRRMAPVEPEPEPAPAYFPAG